MKQQLISVSHNEARHSTIEKAFYTDINQQSQIEKQDSRLRKYVEQIDQKIDYAKWKQQLILKYNYMPIKRITDKAIKEKANYLKRITEEENLSAKILSGKEITVQLDLFREFSKQLNQKMESIKSKIAEEKIKNGLLEKEVQAKRGRLKQKMRENMQTIKSTLEDQGIRNKEDIISLFRSKSMKDNFKPTSLTSRTEVYRKISERKVESQNTKRQHKNRNSLFQECWNSVVESIQSQKRSGEVSQTARKQSERSQLNSIKTDRYTKGQSSQSAKKYSFNKNIENINTFDMNWDRFKTLTYKQIVSILLERDEKGQKLKKILLYN